MGHKCMNFFWGSLRQQVLVRISLCSTCLRFFWDLQIWMFISLLTFEKFPIFIFFSFFFLVTISSNELTALFSFCAFGNSYNVYINSLVVYSQVPYVFFVFFILFFFFKLWVISKGLSLSLLTLYSAQQSLLLKCYIELFSSLNFTLLPLCRGYFSQWFTALYGLTGKKMRG